MTGAIFSGSAWREQMIYTARKGANAPFILDILRLYVPPGTSGCDVTFGKGTFWCPDSLAHIGELRATDLASDGTDLTMLPYADNSQGFHVLDPPYICGFFRPHHEKTGGLASHSDFASRYGKARRGGYKGLFYHAAVEALYLDGLAEAWRVLGPGGVQITKCMDEVSNHRQHLTHVAIVNAAAALGFETLDLFVVIRNDMPHTRRIKRQEHARKNHSYFLVFRKPGGKRRSA